MFEMTPEQVGRSVGFAFFLHVAVVAEERFVDREKLALAAVDDEAVVTALLQAEGLLAGVEAAAEGLARKERPTSPAGRFQRSYLRQLESELVGVMGVVQRRLEALAGA